MSRATLRYARFLMSTLGIVGFGLILRN